MIELYERVVLNRDLPEVNLRAGDLAWLIDEVPHPDGGEPGCLLEIYNVIGEAIAVVTVPRSAIAPLRADQVPAVRSIALTQS